MPILYIMVGAPGSGKTHWVKNFLKDNPNVKHISRDEIRFSLLNENDDYFSQEKKVFSVFSTKITEYLRAGSDTIADATHLNKASREKLVNSILNRGLTLDNFKIHFVFINTTLDQCLRNNEGRTGRAFVTRSVIRRMWYQLEPPNVNEFKNCIGVMTINY